VTEKVFDLILQPQDHCIQSRARGVMRWTDQLMWWRAV